MTDSIEQYQQQIAFFEKSAETKSKVTKSEADRLKLEIELDKLVNSEQGQLKTKASKLKAYYNKLCEDEAKSLKRNQNLLADLQRIDTQFQHLEVKLDRLSNLKRECEVYFRSAYPVWTAENKIFPDENQNYSVNRNIYKAVTNYSQLSIQHQQQQQEQKQNTNQISDLNALITALKSNIQLSPNNNNPVLNNHGHQVEPSRHQENHPTTNVLHNLLISSMQSPAPNQSDHLTQESKHVKNNETLSQLISSTLAKPQDLKHQQQYQLEQQTGQQLNYNDTLLKEYEREVKRQDGTNLADFTLTSSLNYLNPAFHSTSGVDQNNQHLQHNNDNDLNKWSESSIILKKKTWTKVMI